MCSQCYENTDHALFLIAPFTTHTRGACARRKENRTKAVVHMHGSITITRTSAPVTPSLTHHHPGLSFKMVAMEATQVDAMNIVREEEEEE